MSRRLPAMRIDALILAFTLFAAGPVYAGSEDKQSLSNSPEELVRMLENASFLPPRAYRKVRDAAVAAHSVPLGLPPLRQAFPEADDPRRDISAVELAAYAEVLKEIAVESRRDGEILWGRIQGTKYERKALRWIEGRLHAFGIDDVHYDPFPSQAPQWRPTVNELVITAAPGFAEGQVFEFPLAVTAFVSATTVKGGIEGPVIYVGDGTPAELQGRDLKDKIVLLRGRSNPGALLNSARTAYSRLATGRYGKPAGIVVWWEVPRASQVAGRVGAPGGGDAIGKALPWIGIGDDVGLYLRKLLDRATPEHPVVMRLDVQGEMESGEARMSGNVYGILPGQSGEYIVIPTHVDGYFYGIHDNGASVALNLALARHYAALPAEERAHGLIFLFQGDHEVPGVGGTIPFIEKNRTQMEEHLLLVLRPEHLGMMRMMDEALFFVRSNAMDPLMLLVTNRSPVLLDLFRQAADHYSIAMGDFVYVDPAADEAAFHPPYNDLDAISAGWVQTGMFYHSTADVDLGAVDFAMVQQLARGHAFIIDGLAEFDKADLQRGGSPVPAKSIYQSELMKLILGNN